MWQWDGIFLLNISFKTIFPKHLMVTSP